jgi:hypothetical protein
VAALVLVPAALSLAACAGRAAQDATRAAVAGGDPAARLAAFFGSGLQMRGRGSFNLDRVQILRGDRCVPEFVRVFYPAGSASQLSVRNEDAPTGGAQVYLPLRPGPAGVLALSYRLRFPVGFLFNKGGKLPGLYGGDHVAGGDIPDGANGLSTRYMWRAGGVGEVYAYLPTSQVHGTSLGTGSWRWPTGRWVTVQQVVRLNTPGRTDGSITVWLDGGQVLSVGDLVFRTTDTLRIDGVFFSTFFGGGDVSWASPVDQYADFADFRVATSYIPDSLPAGCGPVAGPGSTGRGPTPRADPGAVGGPG